MTIQPPTAPPRKKRKAIQLMIDTNGSRKIADDVVVEKGCYLNVAELGTDASGFVDGEPGLAFAWGHTSEKKIAISHLEAKVSAEEDRLVEPKGLPDDEASAGEAKKLCEVVGHLSSSAARAWSIISSSFAFIRVAR